MNEFHSTKTYLSRRRFATLTLALPLAIAACQTPGSGPPPRRVRLTAATEFAPNLPAVGWSLKVREPDATLSLNTARIAYLTGASEGQYLAGAEWASRAPEMVMELLTESFENTNKILSVGDRRSRIRPTFELETDLREFYFEEVAKDKGRVRVGLVARLIQHPRRNVVASLPFDASTDVDDVSLDAIIAAFDESLRDTMSQLVEWTLRTGVGIA